MSVPFPSSVSRGGGGKDVPSVPIAGRGSNLIPEAHYLEYLKYL